jgi:acetoin utilization deacetylase AcuC-like enzyme
LSSVSTIAAVYLKNKMQEKKIRDTFSEIISDDRVDEFTIHVKNKKNFPFETNASELVTNTDRLQINVGYSEGITDQKFTSKSEGLNLIHKKLERFIYG